MSDWHPVIGLEIHFQAKSKSKVFCSCENSYGKEPNTNTCPICLGHPGVLPRVNQEAIHQIIKAGLMANCKISTYSKFDRKSYFYPDQPKNYQITQFDLPFCGEGKVPIGGKGFSGAELENKDIGLERIHLEEDVGKSTHFKNHSIVDFNRAGIPLMESVSHPEMHSADEAYAYMQSLQQMLRYANVSDCDQEKGQMRCDVNISVHKPNTPFGTKVEIKNLNSNRHVWLSINHEIDRQIEIYENGGTIVQETRRWNDELERTEHMRFKETADDYRYFPDPDLPPVILKQEDIDKIKSSLPMTPKAYRQLFVKDYKITEYDAHVLTLELDTANYFLDSAKKSLNPKGIANIMMNQLNNLLTDEGITISKCHIKPEQLAELIQMQVDGTISSKLTQKLIEVMFKTGEAPQEIAKKNNWIQLNDSNALDELINKAIEENPKAVNEYKEGKANSLQYLMGQVMRFSKGTANPQMATKALKEKLDN